MSSSTTLTHNPHWLIWSEWLGMWHQKNSIFIGGLTLDTEGGTFPNSMMVKCYELCQPLKKREEFSIHTTLHNECLLIHHETWQSTFCFSICYWSQLLEFPFWIGLLIDAGFFAINVKMVMQFVWATPTRSCVRIDLKVVNH